MSVIFVNRFYWPEEPATGQLLTDLAEALAAGDCAVTVIASASRIAETCSSRHSVRILRIRSTRWGRRSLLGRFIDFATFHLAVGTRLLRTARPGDIIVSMTDPPLLGVTAGIAGAIRGAQLVHWVQDIYPEVAVDLTGHRSLLALRPLRNRFWRSAAACVVPGTDMAAAIRTAGVPESRILVSPNWAPAGLKPPVPAEIAALRSEWRLNDKFVVAYSGNLGRAHDLTPLLDVAAELRTETDIAFLFIGDGAQRAALETAARDRLLSNVRFFPSQPRQRLAASLGAGDVHFVTLRPGIERWVFPSKLYGAAALGRPVLVVAASGCELARCVRQQGFGAAFERHEISAMAALVRRLRDNPPERSALGGAATVFAASGASHASESWRRLIAEILAGQPVKS